MDKKLWIFEYMHKPPYDAKAQALLRKKGRPGSSIFPSTEALLNPSPAAGSL